MKYISTAQAAHKWKIGDNRVNKLARAGKIIGATKLGGCWLIPESADKPVDGRTRMARKNQENKSLFRYPNYAYRDFSSFDPPLSNIELKLKQTQEAFYKGEFEEALRLLPQKTDNKYLQIEILYERCYLSLYLLKPNDYINYYRQLCIELQEEFPHKKEMLESVHMIDATLGVGDYYSKQFTVSADYNYHESFLTNLASLSGISLLYVKDTLSIDTLKAHEISCKMIENTDSYTNIQSLHIYLGTAYYYLNHFDEMTYHFKKALELTEKYEMYYIPALQYYYLENAFTEALKNYPKEMKFRLQKLSNDIHNRYQQFMEQLSFTSVYTLLKQDHFKYVYALLQGKTKKEIAKTLYVSESTVSKKTSEIYSILNVKNRAELVNMYNKLQSFS